MYILNNRDYICHWGVKGQKWGIRKYQNEDGTFNEAGKKRYFDTDGKMTKDGKHLYKTDKRSEKDVNKLNKTAGKMLDSFNKLENWNKSHTYDTDELGEVILDNPRLNRNLKKNSNRINKVINKMTKKYGEVTWKFDEKSLKEGKKICDFMINGEKVSTVTSGGD